MVTHLLLLEVVEVRLAGSRLRLLIELHSLLLLGHFCTTTGSRGTLSDNLHTGTAEFALAQAFSELSLVATSILSLRAVILALLIGAHVTSTIQWRLLGHRRLLKSLVRRRARLIVLLLRLRRERLGGLPEGVEHDEIIILRHILLETVMLAKECDELLARFVVRELLRTQTLLS